MKPCTDKIVTTAILSPLLLVALYYTGLNVKTATDNYVDRRITLRTEAKFEEVYEYVLNTRRGIIRLHPKEFKDNIFPFHNDIWDRNK